MPDISSTFESGLSEACGCSVLLSLAVSNLGEPIWSNIKALKLFQNESTKNTGLAMASRAMVRSPVLASYGAGRGAVSSSGQHEALSAPHYQGGKTSIKPLSVPLIFLQVSFVLVDNNRNNIHATRSRSMSKDALKVLRSLRSYLDGSRTSAPGCRDKRLTPSVRVLAPGPS